MILQYIGKKPKLFFDPPWLLGGPYMFDPEVEDGCVEVHPADGRDMVDMSPKTFYIVSNEDESFEDKVVIDLVSEEDPTPELSEDEILVPALPVEEQAALDSAGDPKSEHICFLCGKEFKTAAGLKTHITTKHPEVGNGGN